MTDRRSRVDGAVRRALLRASPLGDVEVERLVTALPSMLRESARRRRLAADPAIWISAAAFQWLPRLAAATALLVVAAILWPGRGITVDAVANDQTTSFGSWVSDGVSTEGGTDPVLAALVE